MTRSALLPAVPGAERQIRLVGLRLIDGTGAAPVDDAEVVIDDDRIAYAGPRRTATGAADAIDLGGRTVLPGFIDVHVHLAMSLETPPAKQLGMFPSEHVLSGAVNARRTLHAGVTTARDLAGLDAGFRAAIADGTIAGPRLHLALAALSPTGGHTDPHLPNGRCVAMLEGPYPSIIDTDGDVRRVVRTLIRSGADTIKVCTTGGVSSPSDTPDDIGVPAAHVRLIVEEAAKRQGQPVAAHAQGAEGILEAIRGGASSVEHGYGIDDEGISLMLEHGTVLVPTLSSALRVPDPAKVPGYLYEKKVRWSSIARDRVAAAFAAGVRVALGTDSGVCPHGRNLTELGHMVELGLSPMAAIQAGTRHAAELLRLEEHLGTLREGMLADLVVTDADPLRDIDALSSPERIRAVLQGGLVRKDLDLRFAHLDHTALDARRSTLQHIRRKEHPMTFIDEATAILPELQALRRDLHQIPEVGLDLPETQARVLRSLEGLPLEITLGTKTSSVTAVLRGERPGRVVLLRGDMDGLPVREENDLDYRSTNGRMHACGHDLHTAGLVGAARLLSAHRDQLQGSVIFMFQPGEEGYNGASVMIEEGVLDAAGERPIGSYAIHVGPGPRGIMATRSGTLLAGSSELHITVNGKGGHGSQPHTGKDPVLPLALIAANLQSMITRRIEVFDPVIITVTQLSGGEAINVIPPQASLGATVRTMSQDALDKLPGLIEELASGIASAYGCSATVDFDTQYIPTVNDDAETAFVLDRLRETYGIEQVIDMPHGMMGSEDFSFVLAEVPGTFISLSASPDDVDPATAAVNHSPHVLFDDSVLAREAAILADLAMARLKRAAVAP